MATTSNHSVSVTVNGDVNWSQVFAGVQSITSPAMQQVIDLVNGNNTITLPVPTGQRPIAVIIIPPSSNLNALVIKGVAGDTGLSLAVASLNIISISATQGNFVISATGAINGVRFIWI